MGAPGAKTAIDVACWDVFGKSVDLPVAELLGGTLQEHIPLALSVPIGTPEAAAEYVSRHRGLGVTNFQIKVGDAWAADVERVRIAIEAAGPGTSVVVDANGGWSLQSALLAVKQLDDLPIHLEQPCRTLGDCAELRKHTSLPMILDESICSLADLALAKSLGMGWREHQAAEGRRLDGSKVDPRCGTSARHEHRVRRHVGRHHRDRSSGSARGQHKP